MKKFFTLVKKNGVETAMVSLESVKAAARVISVPALGPAAEILYSVLEKVYQSQQNAGTVHEIADLCLRAHATLAQHLQNMEITPALSDGIQQFEADLRNAQETVDNYENKTWINRLVYSKSNTDDLQRLEKRVNSTLSLFQIKNLLSLNEIGAKIHASIQRVEQTTVGMNATLQRIEQTIVGLMNCSEPAPRSEGASVHIISRSEFTPCKVITDGPEYSLQIADMRGKAVTIRVITGCKAKSTWDKAVKLDKKVVHPNLPHLIGISSPDSERPFLVYDLDIKDPIESVILSSMSQGVDEIADMCSRMASVERPVICSAFLRLSQQIPGISSALNNLSEQVRLFDLDAKDFDILWDARGRVVLAIHQEAASSSTASVAPDDHTSRLSCVMDDICFKIFRSVHCVTYVDEADRECTATITQSDDTSLSFISSSSQKPSNTTAQREFAWLIPETRYIRQKSLFDASRRRADVLFWYAYSSTHIWLTPTDVCRVLAGSIAHRATVLTPKFERTRARLLSIPSDVEWVGWAEDEGPYKQLPDIEGTVFVDGSIRHFIVDGLGTAFPKATVVASPTEIRQLRERKSKEELELLKCANEATLLAIRLTHKQLHVGIRESDARQLVARALADAGLRDGDCLPYLGKMPPFLMEAAPTVALAPVTLPCSTALPLCTVIGATSPAHSPFPPPPFPTPISKSGTLSTRHSISRFRPPMQVWSRQARRRSPEAFLGLAGYAKYFTHRLGHGICLEVHEDPYLNGGSETILQIGHTFSDEPGMYIEGKVGMRLEDCFYIAQNGSAVYLTAGVGGPAESPWKPQKLR
ncbi:hypothetical protein ARMGADRAFT_1085465 [Armillaria gallica]|uniref:Peptidase M24 domain-containing protein n=1 Tax=Armillaria gallica TaxID=47427 RepID=A0A2H3D036_ARMGA|nr:hypothetical protein ARMGADRAFT_1085465 [Armillaria gallica]